MKLNHSKKSLILSTTLFLVVLGANILFANLLVIKITTINDQIRQSVISSQERERNLNLRDSILNSVSERSKLEKYFVGVGDAETANFISYLESEAKKVGLVSDIKSVGYEPVAEIGSSEIVSLIRFRLSVNGKWSNVFTFIQTLENLPKISTVNAISLDHNSGVWSAEIDFSVAKLKS